MVFFGCGRIYGGSVKKITTTHIVFVFLTNQSLEANDATSLVDTTFSTNSRFISFLLCFCENSFINSELKMV